MGSWADINGIRDAIKAGLVLRSLGRDLVAHFLGGSRERGRFSSETFSKRLAVVASVLARVPLGKVALSEVIGALFEAHPTDDVERIVAQALGIIGPRPHHNVARRSLFRATLAALAPRSLSRALAFGETHFDRARGQDTALGLARLHVRAGAIRRPLDLLVSHGQPNLALAQQLREERAYLERGMEETSGAPAAAVVPANPRRSLYYVSQSLPHHSSGYAIRTHYLLTSLKAAGWDMACYARFGYPNDRWDFRVRPKVATGAEVDGVSYTFRPDRGGFRTLSPVTYQRSAVDVLMDQAVAFRPAILHCASNYLVGQAGTEAARRLGLPSIYEVRGLWHLTRASKQPGYDGSEHYRMTEGLEVGAARRADHVLAITAGVRDLLIAGGVGPERITLLPNAVDPDHFAPRDRDAGLAAALGLRDQIVLGFIGSFAPYEGLELLLCQGVGARRPGDVHRAGSPPGRSSLLQPHGYRGVSPPRPDGVRAGVTAQALGGHVHGQSRRDVGCGGTARDGGPRPDRSGAPQRRCGQPDQ